MIAFRRIFLPVFVLVVVGSCRHQDDIRQEHLFGKWNIMKAERNGKETPYLRGGYLVIGKDGKMIVNISGSDETTPYTMRDHVIRTQDNREFILETLKTDSMIVHFTASPQSEFVFYMVRQHDSIQ